jgi:hypothetical protein
MGIWRFLENVQGVYYAKEKVQPGWFKNDL